MGVIAEPQRISILASNCRVASPAEKTSLMAKIANFLYPDWAHQMEEDLRESFREK